MPGRKKTGTGGFMLTVLLKEAQGRLDCGHVHTLLGALAAGAGAFLAVLVIVLRAFCGALLAQIGADAAELFGPLAAEAHQLCCVVAGGRALHAQLDAPRHLFHVLFLQTGRSTVIAEGCAAQAGVDTFLIVVVIHKKRFV
jgi:hypothetical protein